MNFTLLANQPMIDVVRYPQLKGNINGPSLIRVPEWINNPLGRYYLYFAHHEGDFIRLAFADDLEGPWQIHEPGTLSLAASGFCTEAPKPADTDPEILRQISLGIDGDYPHVASPDVHIDAPSERIFMYFHGRIADGTQHTRLATSIDGIQFETNTELLGTSYFRVFKWKECSYAIALGGLLYRSADSESGFECSHRITSEKYRHGAVVQIDSTVYVAWTRAEDSPERLLLSRLDCSGDWRSWQLQDSIEIRRPTDVWEGADRPCVASRFGGVMEPVNQLRDPCFFQEDGCLYLLYSFAGEQGIAIGRLEL